METICPNAIEPFDCKCYIDFNYISQECPYGLAELDCRLDNKNLTHLITKLSKACYSALNLENVDLIARNAFEKISLISSASLNFKKVSQISSFAFVHIKSSINVKIDDDFSTSTQFESKSFSLIKNLTLIEFRNFKLLELKRDFFHESIIQTILVNRSKFYGFNYSANTSTTLVKHLLIKDSYTNGILNERMLGYFYSLQTVTIINSGIEIVHDIFNKYNQLKSLDLGLNSIRSIDFNNHLLELNLFNNPVENFSLIGRKLTFLGLKSTLIEKFSLKAPNLEHMVLADSKYVTKFKNLNSLLDQIEEKYATSLELIDMSHDEVYMDDKLFAKEHLEKKNCLWNGLVNRTFIKINKHHRCDCSTIYLYKNLDLTLQEIRLVPVCYAKLLIESKVKERQNECGLKDVYLNCSFARVSTVMPVTFESRDQQLFVRKKIEWELTVPITVALFVSSLFMLTFFVLRAKIDFSKKFDNVYRSNDTKRSDVIEQSEMNEILTISTNSIQIRLNQNV
ncbi:hypothetical protein BpHYR1_019295 [Brachionus plicatilis]|uniref:Uncharacterized protein n=1 Tax=Brachionus plicatilis TaxID=10195 RepID=A0A3M7RH54_BRAPC|nr:hypothetical protein BpHYR1_019295 [Brachionus plicatilis]